MYEINEMNPMRSPSWRCERVLQLLDNRPIPLRPTQRDDEIVKHYYLVMRDYWAAQQDPDAHLNVLKVVPEIVLAHQLHFLPEHEFCRQILEARLLARQPCGEIESKMGLSKGVVIRYQLVFFDIEPRLGNVEYIRKMVLTPPRSQNNARKFRPAELAKYLYRTVAYYGGVEALEMVLGMGRSQPQNEKELAKWLDGMLDENLSRRVLEELFATDIDQQGSQKMMKLAMRFRGKGTTANDAADEEEMQARADKIIEAVVDGMHPREKEIYFATRDGVKAPIT